MNIGERIKLLRQNKDMSKLKLSELINVSPVSIAHWECGNKKPSAEAIISLARIFNISSDYLLGIDKKPESIPLSRQEKELLSIYRLLDNYGKQLIDSVSSIEKNRILSHIDKPKTIDTPKRYIRLYTTPSAAGSSIPVESYDYEMISVSYDIPKDADYAVKIQGNSMLPYISDGDIVYIKKDAQLSIGDIGIFSVDGAMYCKQYSVDSEGNLTLLSTNPEYKHTNVFVDKDSNTEVKCFGKVLL